MKEIANVFQPQFPFKGIVAAMAQIGFNPRTLFANSEPGVWYDPSDLSTLFQDAAGTTPVTAVEQPVGLMLDKSKGLVLGPELVTNGDFSNGTTGWTVEAVAPSSVTFSSGSVTLYRDAASSDPAIVNIGEGVLGKTYLVTFDVLSVSDQTKNIGIRFGVASSLYPLAIIGAPGKKRFIVTANGSGLIAFRHGGAGPSTVVLDNISVRELPGNHARQTTATSRPVLSARVNQYLATETLATQNVTTLAAQYLLSFEGAGTITLSGTATGVYSAGSHLITCTAGTLTSTVSGSVTKADLRVANGGVNLPPYQRVNTATDYDTQGFPHYLRFDGVDDWMVTPTITPGTDKVQVFAGVRKQDDTAGMVVELSSNWFNFAGTFHMSADGVSTVPYDAFFASKGSNPHIVFSGNRTAPWSGVHTGLGDISGPLAAVRVNGAATSQNTGSQGTGNYLAYPLYIGRRGGTTLPFNGHIYDLIVRFGSNLPAATIGNTEKYINTKTRAY